MASAWGLSWGSAWGNSWGAIESVATFIGPSLPSFYLQVDVAMVSRDFSGRFTGDTLTFALNGTPPAGVTLDAAGVLSGTPTETGAFGGLSVTATDADLNTADSNTFTITVGAAGFPSGGGGGRLSFGMGMRGI